MATARRRHIKVDLPAIEIAFIIELRTDVAHWMTVAEQVSLVAVHKPNEPWVSLLSRGVALQAYPLGSDQEGRVAQQVGARPSVWVRVETEL